MQDASPSLGSPTNQSAAALWKCCGVRKVANHASGVEFWWRVDLPAVVPGPNPAASGVVAEDGGRWEFPGTRVKPRWWFAGCMARWCGVATAAQRGGVRRSCVVVVLRCSGGGGVARYGAGEGRGLKRGGAGDLGVRARA